MYCQNCGKEIDNNVKFCSFCGTAIKQESHIQAQKNDTLNMNNRPISEKKNVKKEKIKKPIYKKKRFWILAILIVFFFWSMGNAEIDDTETRWEGTLGDELQLSDLNELTGRSITFTGSYWSIRATGEYIFSYKEKYEDGTEVTVDFFVTDNIVEGDMSELDDKSYEDNIVAEIRGDLDKIETDEDGRNYYYVTAYSIEYIENEETKTEVVTNSSTASLSYDLYTDIGSGLLYVNEEGRIIDKSGNTIEEYSDLYATEAGYLSNGVNILEGIVVGENNKLQTFVPNEVEYSEENRVPETFEENISRDVIINERLESTQMSDDGSYFDEVVSEAWFDESGMPIAEFPPISICVRRNSAGYWWLDQYYNVDNVDCSIDDIKRSSSDQNDLLKPVYSILVQNVQKYNNNTGEIYLQGFEYYSVYDVVLHGNFSDEILNGDDLLVFCTYNGLATDDTPNFSVIYAEIINGRL